MCMCVFVSVCMYVCVFVCVCMCMGLMTRSCLMTRHEAMSVSVCASVTTKNIKEETQLNKIT